jgi:ABC-2 type transport system ATP-binding protein
LRLHTGELTGIVGENGNGKTTLLRIVAGDLAIDSGLLRYPAIPAAAGDWYQIKQHLAFIPQNLRAWRGKLKDNLHFAAANHGIFGNENEEAVDFIIHRLGLTRYRNAVWSEISSGYKLRFELAKALVWRPKILILDEPLANLDINAKLLFMQDLRLLAGSLRHPMAILMSSQQLHEIERVVDNILFLKEGKMLYNGKVAAFGQDRQTNTFEVSGNFDSGELQKMLAHWGEIQIEDTGQSLLIEVPIHIDSSLLLSTLTAEKRIDYFRDISRSTRKLF